MRWAEVVADGDERGVLLLVGREGRSTLLGRGDPEVVAQLVERRASDGVRPGWMSVPRGCVVGPDVLEAMGLRHFSSWDWLSAVTAPDVASTGVDRLDPRADADAIRQCLGEANPGTTADPAGAEEVGWWGVAGDRGLDGVVGAALRGGPPPDGFSWHLHGLGVRSDRRGRGLGARLTAAATAAGLAAGASWVGLGMYADNEPARRIYHRLGFTTHARFDSYGPADARRPPA